MSRIVVIGAGGMAREVKWIIESLAKTGEELSFAGYVVSDLQKRGPYDSVDETVGDAAWLRENRHRYDGLALGIGSPAARVRVLAEMLPSYPEELWPALVHPSVIIDRETMALGPGAMLCAGVVGTVNIRLAPFALVNAGVTLGHEAHIGRASVVNPGANVGGGVEIEDGALVGSGARVLQYLRVGAGATVGSGAVVTKNVDAGKTVVGTPARELVKG